jgi:hypothetical protein
VVAADAGPLEIQLWEEAVYRCAEAVPQSTRQDTLCPGTGQLEKVSRRARLKRSETGICPAPRHRNKECAETHGSFELEKDVSCHSPDHGWRTKLDFSRGKSFDDLHGPTILGAAPKIGRVFAERSIRIGLRLLWCVQQVKAKREHSGTRAVGQEAEVADAHEALRKQV